MEMHERITAVAIPIAIPPGLAEIRERWDLAASQGAQPHVTVLYPFLPETSLSDAVRADLAAVATVVELFEVRFERVQRFDGVVWIRPQPSEPFRRLTRAVFARWPEYPPYEGVHDVVIPHLTVTESETAPLAEIETEVGRLVPFTSRAEALELWCQEAGLWRPKWRFALGVRP